MQDKYAGDIGDFGKYILLKNISAFGMNGIRLGVNWYYCKLKELNSTDGRHTDYLSKNNKHHNKFLICDPKLLKQLNDIVHHHRRSIRSVEELDILQAGTSFYSTPIPENSSSKNIVKRTEWFEDSKKALSGSDIIFLDPDNGIAPDKATIFQKRAVKYSFTDEMISYYDLGKSLIVYNHRDRSPTTKYLSRLKNISLKTTGGTTPILLRFKRVSVRDYLILPQKSHKKFLEEASEQLIKPPYDFLFTKISL
ncbi:MAG: hypothetical protein HY964_10685 [Ignavibacteriales bacterium]|nr:hypothetical protein [Ignavibacteriales bacterium]